MKRLIYMVLTLLSALSIGGCSSAITTKDLTIIEEAENQEAKKIAISDIDDKATTDPPLTRKDNASSITKANSLSALTQILT